MRNHKFPLFSVFFFYFQKTSYYVIPFPREERLLSYPVWLLGTETPPPSDIVCERHKCTLQGKEQNKHRLYWVPIESITRNETLISSILIKNVLPRTI